MKALTLWQPWAWCVAHAGKDIENRGWQPPKWILEQSVAIHAGKKYDKEAAAWLVRNGYCMPPSPSVAVSGAIIAVTTVTGWVTESDSKWFGGPIGWVLECTVPLPDPIPWRGAQGLWTVPHHVELEIRKQVKL